MTHAHSQKSWQDVSKVVKKAMSSRVELYIVVLSKLSLYGLSINHPIYLRVDSINFPLFFLWTPINLLQLVKIFSIYVNTSLPYSTIF